MNKKAIIFYKNKCRLYACVTVFCLKTKKTKSKSYDNYSDVIN